MGAPPCAVRAEPNSGRTGTAMVQFTQVNQVPDEGH